MNSSTSSKQLAELIELTSPLYDYWKSPQHEQEEEVRLEKASKEHPAAGLFKNEPYKWEILFQSIIREIKKGDKDSIRGLRILILMLNDKEQENIIQIFSTKQLSSEEVITRIKQADASKSPTKRNLFRFIRILFAIFTNPYCIEIKREKKHSYEKVGSILYSLRKQIAR